MAIKDRNLASGTELTAKYKGARYTCKVEDGEDGLVFQVEDGRRFKSLSSAGSAVMDGKAVNGWRFWSVDGEPKDAGPTTQVAGANAKKVLYRLPNQKGVAEGKSRWFCNACMSSFLVDAGERPETCPSQHGRMAGSELQ